MNEQAKAARTKRQRIEAKEAAILAVAEREFVAHGFDGARMAEIARRAGMGEGTLYLYFRTKSDLLAAVAGAFWGRLTAGAEETVSRDDATFERLEALAAFHLERVMADFTLLELALYLRLMPGYDQNRELAQRRAYVAVFDAVFQQGVDRGDLRADAVLWMARDMFYGTLEYAARTLLLHNRRDKDGVVAHLMDLLAVYSTERGTPRPHPSQRDDLDRIATRLDQAVARLEDKL